MALERRVRELKDGTAEYGPRLLPASFQGVGKDRIRAVLGRIDRATMDMVDVVFALLDKETDSWFSNAPEGVKFADGATTAHIACHVGILQRGGNKLDREGRDYWIKPLRDIGAIEPVYFHSAQGIFIPGHPVPKSSNSAYRLSADFKAILTAGQQWEEMLGEWIQADRVRERLQLQAKMAERSRRMVDTKHSDLIAACKTVYASSFLAGYQIIYDDEADGARVTSEEQLSLREAGIQITLADAMPDILLWNPLTDQLWAVEAVTSDGEVDIHKFNQLTQLAQRFGKPAIGFTTAYQTWKDAARRQGQYKNIAPDTFVWIAEDPSKQLHVLAMLRLFEEDLKAR